MPEQAGPLVIVGGHEDKVGDREILRVVAGLLGDGPLVIATVASHQPEGYFSAYREAFAAVGRHDLVELAVDSREQAHAPEAVAMVAGAAGVFFSGGDQQRLVDLVGGTLVGDALKALHTRGGLLVGTSAGASALGARMIVAGPSDTTPAPGCVELADGLGFCRGVLIDQHFAERGRIGRLVAALAENAGLVGIGIDEDTAIHVDGTEFAVIGSGGVTVICTGEARLRVTASAEGALSIRDVHLHILAAGDRCNLDGCDAANGTAAVAER